MRGWRLIKSRGWTWILSLTRWQGTRGPRIGERKNLQTRPKMVCLHDSPRRTQGEVCGQESTGSRAGLQEIEERLALRDLGFLEAEQKQVPSFNAYSQLWLEQYAKVECKPSTVAGYSSILKTRLAPVFGEKALDQITRNQIKEFLTSLARNDFSRNTLRNAHCTLRVILNCAVEDGIITSNPAVPAWQIHKNRETKVPSNRPNPGRGRVFLKSAQETCPEYYPLFLTALRAGLRRGELVALHWGDIQFGSR